MLKLRTLPLIQRSLSSMNKFSIPSNKSLIPSYSDSSAFLDPDENLGQILFKPKQEYVPRDLNSKNSDRLLSRKVMQKSDVLNELNIDPLKEYKNVRMLSHFVTEIGFIKPRVDTGLSTKNQKRVAKAIRRARSMGLMPYTFKLKVDNSRR